MTNDQWKSGVAHDRPPAVSDIHTRREIPATVTPSDAAAHLWDVVVVGAGPAGSLLARDVARQGVRVLLVDKAPFPRDKVCGCCVNGTALETLAAAGLPDVTGHRHAHRFDALRLAAGGRRAAIPLPPGVALSRRALDASLLLAAVDAGVAWLPRASAQSMATAADHASLRLRHAGRLLQIHTRVVVAACGLGGAFLKEVLPHTTWHRSRIGLGAILPSAPPAHRGPHITMACGRHGYVGTVEIEDGALAIAAAADTAYLRRHGHPARAAEALLSHARHPPIEGLDTVQWQGTPALTVRPSAVAARRLFLVGDAAGYIEPFTGEGIGWAMASALAAAPSVAAAAHRWRPELIDTWCRTHAALLRHRQRRCRVIAEALRHPAIVRGAVHVLGRWPGLGRRVAASLK